MIVYLNIVDRTPNANKFIAADDDGFQFTHVTMVVDDGATKGQILDKFWETYPDLKACRVSFPYLNGMFEDKVILECEVSRTGYPFQTANYAVKWISHDDFNENREIFSELFCSMMRCN